jgi:hypothetical protein
MEDNTLYDYAPDNDGLDYTSHYSAQRPYRSYGYNGDPVEELEDPVEGNSWGRLGCFLDFVIGPRFAFVVAIVVVLVFQFQGTFFSFLPPTSKMRILSWWMDAMRL